MSLILIFRLICWSITQEPCWKSGQWYLKNPDTSRLLLFPYLYFVNRKINYELNFFRPRLSRSCRHKLLWGHGYESVVVWVLLFNSWRGILGIISWLFKRVSKFVMFAIKKVSKFQNLKQITTYTVICMLWNRLK